MLLFIVGPELDLALEACELTGLVEGDGVGAVQDVISCLEHRDQWRCFQWRQGSFLIMYPLLDALLTATSTPDLSIPAHKEGSAGRDHENPHSDQSRRTFFAAEASRAPLHPVPAASGHGPTSSLGYKIPLSAFQVCPSY